MNYKKIKKGINLADIRFWWEKSAGDLKAGHFNYQLYIRFLEIYNQR